MKSDKMNPEQEKNIDELEKKINEFSSILEKFGMDIVTKLGNVTFNIKVLTNKVDDLSKATLDIKLLKPQLKKIIDNQNNLDEEVDLLKSLILKKSQAAEKSNDKIIERNMAATDKKQLIVGDLNELKSTIETMKDPDFLIENLNKIKENIFEYTGGHKILYEISKIINKIEKEKEITSELIDIITEKTTFWKNKL